MSSPAITVFMAVYNGSLFLREAIESVLNQTFTDFEFLIINDGSTDNSEAIITSYKDDRIRLLRNEENRGLVYTRNRGVEEAKGEYLAILDCDDVAYPTRLQATYNMFCSNKAIALCCGRALYLDHNIGSLKESPRVRRASFGLIFGNFLINSATAIKLSAVRSVGGYRANAPAEDYDLALRIAENYPIALTDDLFVKYRVHNNNTSLSNLVKLRRAERGVLKDFYERIGIQVAEKSLDIHHSLISGDQGGFSLIEYHAFLYMLLTSPALITRYDPKTVRKVLLEEWQKVVCEKGGRNSFLLFIRSPLFSFQLVTFKQLRKAFKKSLKSIFS